MGERIRRVWRAGLALGLLTVALAGSPKPAEAHNWFSCSVDSPCTVYTWQPDAITIRFASSFPPNSPYPLRDRVSDSILNWPFAASGRPATNIPAGDGPGWFSVNCGTYADGDDRFHWVDLAALEFYTGNLFGWTCIKFNQGRVVAANPAVDSKEAWWPYNSSPPATHVDLESVMTHELGHAWGYYGHFSINDGGCAGSPEAMYTMCPTYQAGWLRFRTTETHDQHTMLAAYQAFP